MDIRVRNSEGEVESRHYAQQREDKSPEKESASGDIAKLLALKRNLMVKGPQLELRNLSKNNNLMKKTLQDVREICMMDETAQNKLQFITALLRKY